MVIALTLPLYHGSLYKQAELKPGFKHTGKLVQWDNTESNLFLYATTNKDTAIELGFASALEKLYDVTHFRSQGKTIRLEVTETLTLKLLSELVVYLYTITPLEQDNWVKNNNKNNGLTTEYKTASTIKQLDSCIKVDIAKWLKQFTILARKPNETKEVALEAFFDGKYKW